MDFNIDKYLGTWYEIASFPSWFQRGCRNATAKYTTIREQINVENSCEDTLTGIKRVIKGKAKKTRKKRVLKVIFVPPFTSDYIVEYVDDGYNYSIVGSSGKNYLWILARNRRILEKKYNRLVNIASNKGYDVSNLVKNH